MVKALIRAPRWRRRIESGRARSITIAEQEGVTDRLLVGHRALTDVISQGESRPLSAGPLLFARYQVCAASRAFDAVQGMRWPWISSVFPSIYGVAFLFAVPISEEEAERGLGKYAAKIGQ